MWARYGIKILRDIMPTGTLLSYPRLSRVFRLPGWMFFRYAQLCHTVRAQFPTQPLLQLDPIMELLSQEDIEKPLSALYGTLLCTDSPKIESLWDLWKQDIPSFDREDCYVPSW